VYWSREGVKSTTIRISIVFFSMRQLKGEKNRGYYNLVRELDLDAYLHMPARKPEPIFRVGDQNWRRRSHFVCVCVCVCVSFGTGKRCMNKTNAEAIDVIFLNQVNPCDQSLPNYFKKSYAGEVESHYTRQK